MTATELHFITVAEAARRIARRELSPVELTEAYLQRIGAFDDQLHSFVTLTADLARWQAQSAEAQILRDGPRSPLHGVPYCLKDIVETAGIRTTGQSKLLAGHIPAEDAVVASKLRDAGGILLGKTATWEFAAWRPLLGRVVPTGAQPVEHGPPSGRLLGRVGRGGRGRTCPRDHRQRHRRLDPRAGGGLRYRRPEANIRPRQSARRVAELLFPRSCRPACLDQRGRGHRVVDRRRA